MMWKRLVQVSCKRCKVSIDLIRQNCSDVGSKPIANAYIYSDVEKGWYEKWEREGQFQGSSDVEKKPFVLLFPPPNVTGTLHLGHALTGSIQDALVRWHRMSGRPVLWIPGLDHAGIATQTVVERHLAAQNLGTRHSLGREKFLEEAWKWKNSKGDFILQQLRGLGCSLDWSREYFTLDETRKRAVVESFVQLYDRGLIFRKEALVNWSCQLQSAIADIEVDWMQLEKPTYLSVPGYDRKVKFGELTHVALPIVGEEGQELVIATTRLETMVGDTAVAVHPDDQRFSAFIGKFVQHPLRPGAKIPVVADDFVERRFGTGAVKITPAHDATDFEVGKRHNLDILPVFSNDGLILDTGSTFTGMKRFTAREEIRKHLHSLGLIRGVTPLSNAKIPVCSRSGDVVELMLKPQWFVKCKGMAEKAMEAVKSGQLAIDPPNFQKLWFQWLENSRDWCISRQLWWGHRIPAYHCKNSNTGEETWVAAASVEAARTKAEKILNTTELVLTQDADVLDTWFSSGLLPFASLGWPEETADLKNFFPLSLMVTGHDILFFWVARMVMLSQELTGKLPFERILLHRIIHDAYGRKMSKSLGNVISPEDVVHGVTLEESIARIEANNKGSPAELKKAINAQKASFPKGIPACGTDALRFSLCSHDIRLHFVNFDINECVTNRSFCNKIWQATKYMLLNTNREEVPLSSQELVKLDLSLMDRWILSRLAETVATIDTSFASENLHHATLALKDFIYYNFCDIYIEASKALLKDPATAQATSAVLASCNFTFIHLMAPFMPFLSEQLYQHFSHSRLSDSVHKNNYPSPGDWVILKDIEAESGAKELILTAEVIRQLKNLCKLTKANTEAFVETSRMDVFEKQRDVLKSLSVCADLTICDRLKSDKKTVRGVVNANTSVYIVGEVNKEDLAKRLNKLKKEEESFLKTMSTRTFQELPPMDQEPTRKKLEDVRMRINSQLEAFNQNSRY